MQRLQKIREETCGGFSDYIAGTSGGSGWSAMPSHVYLHSGSSQAKATQMPTQHTLRRSVCNAPISSDAQVAIERLGPFYSTGNGDWTQAGNGILPSSIHTPTSNATIFNVANLNSQLQGKDLFIKGVLISPVSKNGSFIGFPPLHVHHAHLTPHSSAFENYERILPRSTRDTDMRIRSAGSGRISLGHNLIGQQHGDSLCRTSDGADDFSCLLHQLPDSQGYRIQNSTGLGFDFEVNDVRMPSNPLRSMSTSDMPDPLEALEWYMEVAVIYSHKQHTEATFLHFSNPTSGGGPATYALPIDESTSLIYFNYTHDWSSHVSDHGPSSPWGKQIFGDSNKSKSAEFMSAMARDIDAGAIQQLGAGTVSNIHIHTHQSMFDSLLVFKESNRGDKVFQAIDSLRPEGTRLPYIPECHNDTLEATKVRLVELALGQGRAQLLCEATKPGLVWEAIPTAARAHSATEKEGSSSGTGTHAPHAPHAYHDRLMDLQCLKNIRLEQGDTITVVAFNKARPTSTAGPVTRSSPSRWGRAVYEGERFAQSQHTIVRMDFVSDAARDRAEARRRSWSSKGKDTSGKPKNLRGAILEGNPSAATAASSDTGKATQSESESESEGFYAPPALFLWQRWVHYEEHEPMFGGQARLSSMVSQCPASISL
jgi:hypothetical protein